MYVSSYKLMHLFKIFQYSHVQTKWDFSVNWCTGTIVVMSLQHFFSSGMITHSYNYRMHSHRIENRLFLRHISDLISSQCKLHSLEGFLHVIIFIKSNFNKIIIIETFLASGRHRTNVSIQYCQLCCNRVHSMKWLTGYIFY